MKHGIANSYNRGCRCSACREAKSKSGTKSRVGAEKRHRAQSSAILTINNDCADQFCDVLTKVIENSLGGICVFDGKLYAIKNKTNLVELLYCPFCGQKIKGED